MLNTHERWRLMREMADQPLVKKVIVAQCAVILGISVLTTAIGAIGPDGRAADAPRDARNPAQPTIASGADAYRRENYEQRRQRRVDAKPVVQHMETVAGDISAAPK